MPSPSIQPILAVLACRVGANPPSTCLKRHFHRGLDWRYLTLEIAAEQLGDAVRGLRAMGFRGGNVVGAHKQAVLPLLDRSSDSAALLAASI